MVFTICKMSLISLGYGRSEAEASNNCIKNFFEMVIEDESGLTALIKALKRGFPNRILFLIDV